MVGFQPFVPQSGYSGWSFLQRTQEAQQNVFNKSPELARDVEYFKETISNISSAQELVSDRTLLKVALGAFGLDEDLDKRAYILKVMAEGTEDDAAFSNRLVDKRYHALAETFGFGNAAGPNVTQSNFADNVLSKYKVNQFEIAVGDADQSMRLALSFKREISNYSGSTSSENALWFKIMGNPPMRSIFETTFGLPSSFGGLDVDKQREIFQEKTSKMFGSSSPTQFQESENVDELLRMYFVRKQIAENPVSNIRGSVALSLMQNTSAAMANYFQSRLR